MIKKSSFSINLKCGKTLNLEQVNKLDDNLVILKNGTKFVIANEDIKQFKKMGF